MNTAQPIRRDEDLERIKNFFLSERPNPRNQLLLILGLNTALRISDILSLKWKDVYCEEDQSWRRHIFLLEQKTGKRSEIFINDSAKQALVSYFDFLKERTGSIPCAKQFLFPGRGSKDRPLTRVQAFRLIKTAARHCQISGVISCHSLRKTFGYHAWKQGVEPALLMNIYNHASFQNTKRYLGIDQDDRDHVFRNINL
ncbi:MAG: tyrosine-type recombinase/integrase [Acetatifactor sp.]|nr:tyrosine-type recombinase/integrase [Acetatifactor sp.]